jgi:hypothetical protein
MRTARPTWGESLIHSTGTQHVDHVRKPNPALFSGIEMPRSDYHFQRAISRDYKLWVRLEGAERYLASKQKLQDAVNDRFKISLASETA